MSRTASAVALALLVLGAASYGPASVASAQSAPIAGAADRAAGAPPQPASVPSREKSVPAIGPAEILSLPEESFELLDSMITACVEAIFKTSILNDGRLTVTGTLSEGADGDLRYSASPTDALEVVAADGRTMRVTIAGIEGDLSRDARRFLLHDHSIRCAAEIPGVLDLSMTSDLSHGEEKLTVKGSYAVEGATVAVDLASEGARQALDLDLDTSSAAYATSRKCSGRIESGSVTITVDERTEFKFVGEAQQIRRHIDSDWRDGETAYDLKDGYYQLTLSKGDITEWDYWQARGQLLRDGAPFGLLTMVVSTEKGTNRTKAELLLVTKDAKTVLRTW